jgi:hypothetical protein
MPVERVVSGGQTGVDRAALDVARELGIAIGGWCPKGRRAEDGLIDASYPLQETPDAAYAQRTAWNVRDSDATLVLTRGEVRGGTAQTLECAERSGKPHLVLDAFDPAGVAAARDWLAAHRIRILNVAGPRESKSPGVYDAASAFLRRVLAPDPAP